MDTKEYIIWGIPKGEKHEQVLYTLATNMPAAEYIKGKLENEYQCTKCRIQVLDLTEKPDFVKAILS
jgi:hypothetical protein